VKVLYLALERDLSHGDAAAAHVLGAVRALSAAGVEVTLAAKSLGGEAASKAALAVAGLKPFGRQPARALPEELVAAAREADLIHERASESGGTGVKLARVAGKPLVLEMSVPLSGHKNPLLRRIAGLNLRRQARACRAIIAQTPIARNIIETYTQRPVYIVPPGADPEAFNPSIEPAEPPGARGRTVVEFAGSLRPWHGVEDLIEAMDRTIARQKDVFLLVVGGGRRLRDLESLAARRLGARNYHFTGAVAPAEVPRYLARADVLVAPFSPSRDRVRRKQFSRYGMWWSPAKVFEYMAAGRAIVASTAGMMPEYLAGAGVTYTAGDTTALAEALEELVSDPRLRATLGAAARRKLISEYSLEEAAGKTIEVWREVLGGRQKISLTT
jgi:glycosyltransferase involved in cell wall biosynthesis